MENLKFMSKNNGKEKLSLLAVFAHPDDESIMMGGTLAFYTRRGVEVNVLCATRGEWGTAALSPADRKNLGAIREVELKKACEILGANLSGFLDCPDGKINETNWYETEEKIVRYIRKVRPQVVVTFGPDGLYWHPDHTAISNITTRAFASAGDEDCFTNHIRESLEPFQPAKLYYAAYPDFLMRQMAASIIKENGAAHFWGFSMESFGVPSSQITTMLNVKDTLAEKMRAIRSHKTQLAPDNVFSLIDDEAASLFLSREYFRLARPALASKDIEKDLFTGINSANNRAAECYKSFADLPAQTIEI
jgi:LmbE family N-acetylglucosaminyl deacetylase